MSTNTFVRVLHDSLAAGLDASARLIGRLGRKLRRPLLIVVGSIIFVMLLIVVLQSGLGVDSDETITDSHRPEIVGD